MSEDRAKTAAESMSAEDVREAVKQLKFPQDVFPIPNQYSKYFEVSGTVYSEKAKPSYTIHIIEDLSFPAVPYMEILNGAERIFKVHTAKREEDLSEDFQYLGRRTLLAALAHELGHVIGRIFGLPGASKDPRGRRFEDVLQLKRNDDDAAMYVYKSEEEAWDLAELMLGIKNVRTVALASYRRNFFGDSTYDWSEKKFPDVTPVLPESST